MSKFRKILLVLLGACLTLSVAFAVACADPDVINPEDDPAAPGNYHVSVTSIGGLDLSGVKVNFVNANGLTVAEGVSDSKGEITAKLTPDVYTLDIDEASLPKGYYVPDDTVYKTEADKNLVEIYLPSKVIEGTVPSGTRYNVGDVMYDFSFTEVTTGVEYKLSTVLENKKAVVLNFWGTYCSPCRIEFPAMQEAYDEYKSQLEIFALSSYSPNGFSYDTAERVVEFKNDNGFTMPMALDWRSASNGGAEDNRLYINFGVAAYPTTVIIDRYGVVAEVHSGTITNAADWKTSFLTYTRDAYSQKEQIKIDGDTPTIDDENFEWTAPPENSSMPDSDTLANAIVGAVAKSRVHNIHYENADPMTWPWEIATVDGEQVLSASNHNVELSYAAFTFEIDLLAGEGFSFDYNINTHHSNNILYMLINEGNGLQLHSDSNGWQTATKFYTATHSETLTISFMYLKSRSVYVDSPVYIDNINIYDSRYDNGTIDLPISVVENQTLTNGRYAELNNKISKHDNGIYYYNLKGSNGEEREVILYADILELTAWSTKHFNANYFTVKQENEGEEYDSFYTPTLYNLSFWLMSNYKESDNETIHFKIDYDDTGCIIKNYYLQSFSDNGYVPVTEELKQTLIAFTKAVYGLGLEEISDTHYEDQWLELCLYLEHYGPDHDNCAEYTNPVDGLVFEFSHPVEENVKTHVNITKILNLTTIDYEAGGGLRYTFTPSKSGVYLFRSYGTQSDPAMMVYDGNFKMLANYDDDLRPESYELTNENYANFYFYLELEEGKTYYIVAGMSYAGSTGEYDFDICYYGTYAEYLRVCTTSDGMWTWHERPDGSAFYYFPAVSVTLNSSDNMYYHNDNGELKSPIYVDFVHPNFYDHNGNSLFDLLVIEYDDNGNPLFRKTFDFTEYGDKNYTEQMYQYYLQAIDKDKDDELYGMIEASEDIVFILNKLVLYTLGDSPNANGWLAFANYYEYYGTPSAD